MVNVINISKPSQRGEGGEREGYTTRGRTDMLWYGINYTPDCAKRCIAPITCEKNCPKIYVRVCDHYLKEESKKARFA